MAYTDLVPPIRRSGRDSLRRSNRMMRRGAQRLELESLESRVLLSSVPTHLVIGVQPTNGFVGSPLAFAITVEVTDASGNLVSTDTSAVSLAIATGPAGSLTGTTTVNASGGVATFSNITLTKSGTFTLKASDGALATANTAPINIAAAGSSAGLLFTQQPVGNASGSALTGDVVIEVTDSGGNPVTTPTNVTLSLSQGPAGGKLTGPLTVKTSGGFATFTGLSVTKGGTYVLQAKAGALTATSDGFVMGGPSVATSLHFLQQPSTVAAGVKMAPAVTVEVLDQYGQVMTNDHSVISLTAVPTAGKTKKFTAPVKSGIATFSNVSLTAAGTYTLSATDKTLTGATSSTFSVVSGAATKLTFTALPATGSAKEGPFTITVTAVDKFGNTAASDNSAVTLVTVSSPKNSTPVNASMSFTAGVASFTGVTFDTAGNYVLKAQEDLLPTVNSKSFKLV